MIKGRLLIPPKWSFTGWEHLGLCIVTALILEVTISSLFTLIYAFTVIFGSSSTRVPCLVTAIPFVWILFTWRHKFRTCLSCYSYILAYISYMCSMSSLGRLQTSWIRPLEKIFNSFTCYLLSHLLLHATC